MAFGLFYVASGWSPLKHRVGTRRTSRVLHAGIVDAHIASGAQLELWLELGHSNAPSMVSEHFLPHDLEEGLRNTARYCREINCPFRPEHMVAYSFPRSQSPSCLLMRRLFFQYFLYSLKFS